MDSQEQSPKPRRRVGSMIWYKLNQGTARFYQVLRESSWGRFMTTYRTRETGVSPRRTPSSARRGLVSAMESSALTRGFRAVFGDLLDCPTACYGVFGLLYGLFSILFTRIGAHAPTGARGFLPVSILISVLSVPLLFSWRSLAESLGYSAVARRFLVGFCGIPRDRMTHIGHQFSAVKKRIALVLAGILGVGASAASMVVAPWVVPAAILAFAVLGMVFSYPETGVVLVTLSLPLLWLDNRNLVAVVALILLTWCGYGFQLLLARRTIRFDKLDRVFLILCGMIFIMGFTGYGVNRDSIWQSVALTICLSGYFLIVNLVTNRDLLRRCLAGVAISVVVVTVLAFIRRVPVENLLWLEGSRAGDAIISGVNNAVEKLTQLWVDHSELYLVLVFSWLYAYMLHTKRLIRKFGGAIFVLLDLMLIIMTNSVSAMLCVVAVTILFLLMLGHKWLSVGLLSLPAIACGACWMQYRYPISDQLLTVLSRSRLYKSQLTESLWRMVLEHPTGIGVGDKAFGAVYPAYAAPDLQGVTDCGSAFFEILLGYGWVGLFVWGIAMIFFLQKSFSALRCATVSKDRAMLMGGMTSLLGAIIFGSVRSFITSPRVFFTIMLVIALCSAYANILFSEQDVEEARWTGREGAEDRVYRG